MGTEKTSHHFAPNSDFLRSYFILDGYTGTIQTSKLLDLENFCDLNLCKNRLLKIEDSRSHQQQQQQQLQMQANTVANNTAADIYKQNCLIEFKIKATRYMLPSSSSNTTTTTTTTTSTLGSLFGMPAMQQQHQQTKESVYHITFDLILIDINEFKPEFLRKEQPLVFNVSEEFAPIKLPIGSVAYDNDCNDRGRLFYEVRVVKVNERLLDEYLAEAKLYLTSSSSPYADYMRGNKSTNMFGFQVISRFLVMLQYVHFDQ